MSDEPDETPNPEDLQEFVNKFLGDEATAQEFFAQLEDPMTEAWIGFHNIYEGLLTGGFSKQAAQHIMGVYLYNLVAGSGDST